MRASPRIPASRSRILISDGMGERSLARRISRIIGPFIMQSPASGALPTLFAATSADAQGGATTGQVGSTGSKDRRSMRVHSAGETAGKLTCPER
jgi:hypothetical protein